MTERLSSSQINSYRSLCRAEYADREKEEGEFNTVSCLCDMALALLDRDWHPIETAPKDGKAWLFIGGPGWCMANCVWSLAHQFWMDDEGYEVDCPTHYMVMPEPPPSMPLEVEK